MTNQPLSPAAQAVYNAVLEICPAPADEIAAAALRAAADQLTPYSVSVMEGAALARNKLLAIAAELEAQ